MITIIGKRVRDSRTPTVKNPTITLTTKAYICRGTNTDPSKLCN